MKLMEYGMKNQDVIMLLHGGGLSWWSCREAAEMLQEEYHVILPVLDGHAESERDFTSIEDNAAALIGLIDERFQGSVLLVAGLSLGAQIVVEMLSQRPNLCRYAIAESTLVKPMRLTQWLVKPMISMSYWMIHRDWFSALQFQALGIKEELREAYVRDTRRITRKNLISFLEANAGYQLKPCIRQTEARVWIFVGAKEQPRMLRSARMLNKAIEGSVMEVKAGMSHGDFSINHAAEYVRKINSILKE